MSEIKGEEAIEMFKLVKAGNLLPERIEDLVPLSFIGQAAVDFYKIQLKTMDKLKMAESQREATLRDGQDAGDMLLDIEARIGEFYETLPKKVNQYASAKSAGASIKETGISQRDAQRAVQIHNNPDVVAKIKAQARENKDIPTKTAVINAIQYEQEKSRKNRAEKIDWGLVPLEQAEYLAKLDQVIAILPQKPPKGWKDRTLKEATAKAKLILRRLEDFTYQMQQTEAN